MTALINGYDPISRERAFSGKPADFEFDREFAREAFRSPVGQKFLESIDYDRERDLEFILEKAYEINRNPEALTISMFLHALDVLTTLALSPDRWTPESGRLKRKAVESTPEETPVEVDKNGKRLSASQLAWKEYREFAESHSSNDCKRRARLDAGFASFVRINLEREMSGPIGGAGLVLNAPVASSDAKPSDELLRWVETYRVTPMETVRSKMRGSTNPGGFREYARQFNEACRLGLI